MSDLNAIETEFLQAYTEQQPLPPEHLAQNAEIEGQDEITPEDLDGDENLQIDDIEEEQPEATQDEYYTIKHNGQEIQLTREKLLEHAQKGFDYTQKTTEVAEQRKAIEARRGEIDSVYSNLSEQLNFIEQNLKKPPHSLESIQQLMAEGNTDDAFRAKLENEQHQELLVNVQNQQKAIKEQYQQEVAQRTQELIKLEQQKFLQVYPDMKKPEKAQALQDYLIKTVGVPAETLNSIADSRFFILAEKARRYDDIKARSTKPTQAVPRMLKPSQARQPIDGTEAQRKKQAFAKLSKTNSVDAAAEALQALGL